MILLLFFVGLVAGFICGAIAAFFMQPKQEPDQCRTVIFYEGKADQVLKLAAVPKIGDKFRVFRVHCNRDMNNPLLWHVNWKLEPTE